MRVYLWVELRWIRAVVCSMLASFSSIVRSFVYIFKIRNEEVLAALCYLSLTLHRVASPYAVGGG